MEREREKERREWPWQVDFFKPRRAFLQYLENTLIANEERYGQILKHRNVITIIMTTTKTTYV